MTRYFLQFLRKKTGSDPEMILQARWVIEV